MGQAECSGAELDGAWQLGTEALRTRRAVPCPPKKDNFSWSNNMENNNSNKSKGKITANVFKLWSWSSCCSAALLLPCPFSSYLSFFFSYLLSSSFFLLPPLLAAPAVSLAVIYNFNLVVQFSLSWLQHNEPNTSAPFSPSTANPPLFPCPALVSNPFVRNYYSLLAALAASGKKAQQRQRQGQRQRLL